VRAAFDALRERYDLVVVEAAGGALVPFADGIDMAALAALLRVPVVVAARPGLGTLNHTLLTLEAARRRGLTVAGVVLNRAEPGRAGLPERMNPETLRRTAGAPVWGPLPYNPSVEDFRRLAAALGWTRPE
jgi:dethiobiotin synthetase